MTFRAFILSALFILLPTTQSKSADDFTVGIKTGMMPVIGQVALGHKIGSSHTLSEVLNTLLGHFVGAAAYLCILSVSHDIGGKHLAITTGVAVPLGMLIAAQKENNK